MNGYGYSTPNDGASALGNVEFAMRRLLQRMATTRLVRVEKVSGSANPLGAAGTVDVLPLVHQVDGIGNATPHGVVHGIPWCRLQGGTGAVICDPKVGDIGYVVVSDRDITNVKTSLKPSTPGSFRTFDLADGIYVGGVLNGAPRKIVAFLDDKVLIQSDDQILLTVPGGPTVTITATAVALAFGANSIVVDGAGIHLNGPLFIANNVSGPTAGATVNFGSASITTTGDVVANGKHLSTHVHGGVAAGGGNTSPPV